MSKTMKKPKQLQPNEVVSIADSNSDTNAETRAITRPETDTAIAKNKINTDTAIGNIDSNSGKEETYSGHEEESEYEHFVPQSAEEALALDIVNSLGEPRGNLPLFIAYCRKYPRPILERAWTEARHTPPSKIKKSRGALFNYLVQKHAREECSARD